MLAVRSPDGILSVGRAESGDLQAIGTFPLPACWAASGDSFAFIRESDVWVVQADGSGARNLTNFELGGAVAASCSPDGRYIAVLQGRTLWVFGASGGQAARLGTGYTATISPLGSVGDEPAIRWSPDGTWLAAEREGLDITLFRAGDWHPVRLETAGSVVWSPDGRFVAMIGGDGDRQSIDVANADGSGRRSIWTGTIVSGPVVWVP
jgi:hypothetical protein